MGSGSLAQINDAAADATKVVRKLERRLKSFVSQAGRAAKKYGSGFRSAPNSPPDSPSASDGPNYGFGARSPRPNSRFGPKSPLHSPRRLLAMINRKAESFISRRKSAGDDSPESVSGKTSTSPSDSPVASRPPRSWPKSPKPNSRIRPTSPLASPKPFLATMNHKAESFLHRRKPGGVDSPESSSGDKSFSYSAPGSPTATRPPKSPRPNFKLGPKSPLASPKHLLATLNHKAESFLHRRRATEEGPPDNDGAGLWQKEILMGEKCQPLDFSGVIYYDRNGKLLSEVPTRSPRRGAPVAQSFSFPVTSVHEKDGF